VASASPREPFVELKPKNNFTDEVKPCQTRPYCFFLTTCGNAFLSAELERGTQHWCTGFDKGFVVELVVYWPASAI
jgi:hypothetical protein